MSKIAVIARLRPWINGENQDDLVSISDAEGIISVREGTKLSKFTFKSCYGQNITQEEIFEKDVRPLLFNVFRGLMVTVFAYGVTSSGKTHTMQGNLDDEGIIPRVVKSMFIEGASLSPAAQKTLAFHLSYMEVYKDDVFDLFVERTSASRLAIMTNEHGQTIIPCLTYHRFQTEAEFNQLYAKACKARSVASTNLNRSSSRSHAILGITVTFADESAGAVYTGKMNLVDLAGSENNKMTGNDPSRMAESSAINKSLTTLGMVVKSLNRNEGRIPYRDSKLTRILQDALGGSSIGLLICCLAPGKKFAGDTINTLNFGGMAKSIENKPVINERPMLPTLPTFRPSISAKLPNIPVGHNRRGSFLPVPSASSGIAVPMAGSKRRASVASGQVFGLSEADIEERIAKRVEMEVNKRLEEMQNAKELDRQRELKELGESMRKNQKEMLNLGKGRERGIELVRGEKEGEKEMEVDGEEGLPSLKVGKGEIPEADDEEEIPVVTEEALAINSSQASSEDQIPQEVANVEQSMLAEEPILEAIQEVSEESNHSPNVGVHERPEQPEEPTNQRILASIPQTQTPFTSETHSKSGELTLPSDVLDTLIFKHHQTQDDELIKRLTEVEQKYAKGDHLKLADVLSPKSRKKTARAYVELARSSHDRGETQQALDMYTKASAYKPDSDKLSNRIFQLQLALMEGVPAQPRRKSYKPSSRHSNPHSHRHSPYEGNTRSIHTSRSSAEDPGRILGELTNSPRKERVVGLGSLKVDLGKGGTETPEGQKGQAVGSPSGAEWFMAPRKGGIGKARKD